MARFSIGEAFGASFRVIKRKPLAPLVWGIAYLIVGFLPAMWMMSAMFGSFGDLAAMGDHPDPVRMQQAMGPMMAFQGPIMLAGVVLAAVLISAVFRSVLEPENSQFFYLRLGAQEFWVGLVYICQMIIGAILGYALIGIPAIIAGVIGGVSTSGHGEAGVAGGAIVGVLIGVTIGLAVFVWLAMRFSMAIPMSFHDRTFRLFESWRLMKGNSLRMFGLFFLIMLMVCVIEAVIAFVVLAALGVSAFSLIGDADAIQSFFKQSPATIMSTVGPVALAIMAVIGVVGGYLYAICYAPWADAYRQLTASRAAGAPAGEA